MGGGGLAPKEIPGVEPENVLGADAQKGIFKGVIFASTYDAEGEGVLNSAIRRGQKIPKQG